MRKSCLLMKSILALCLCLVLLAGTACAEGIVTIASAQDDLEYRCTLPDGRIVLAGSKTPDGEGSSPRACVLCLNPDRTVSWEFIDRDENGFSSVYQVTVLPDGTIAAVFARFEGENRTQRAKFFTQDGQPTGRELEISGDPLIYGTGPSWLLLYQWDDEEQAASTVLTDWDGNEITRYPGLAIPGGYGSVIGDTAEPVVVGQDSREIDCYAKILKLDSGNGEVVWQTTLPWQLPDTVGSMFVKGTETEDGGYAAWLSEYVPGLTDDSDNNCDFLVKLDADGRVQWITREGIEEKTLGVRGVLSGNGKIGVYCVSEENGSVNLGHWIFVWYDLDGKELGTTELNLDSGSFPGADPEYSGTSGIPIISVGESFSMEDGLWALGAFYTKADFITSETKKDTFLVKIPEP